ncbi:MAG: FliH/SctL family protein [Beijerinckiaceae bacterium]
MSHSRFTFEREFPATKDNYVPLEQKEPTITVAEHELTMSLALEQARNESYAEGKLAADTEETARLARAMESVSHALEVLRHSLDGIEASASAEAITFAHEFARKLAGKLIDTSPVAVIEDVARQIFDDLRGQSHVAVRVSPELVDITKEKISGITRERGFEGRLIVLGEPENLPGDVKIEWADGGIVRDRARVERTVAEGVDRALAAGMTLGS